VKSRSDERLVAIDSQVLVWGVRNQGSQKQLQRAQWLFQGLEQEEAQIVVPAVALSEFLTAVGPKDQENVVTTLTARFIIAPFDVKCAALAARLFSEGKGVVKRGKPGGRSTLRADALIIASAALSGARTFYSGDAKCRKLAQRVSQLTVHDLPTIPPTLFEYADEDD
jgi:predicted nucleic acid-binding protein